MKKKCENWLSKPVTDLSILSAGSSTSTYKLKAEDQQYFLKTNLNDNTQLLNESVGLKALEATGTRTPKIIDVDKQALLLEHVEVTTASDEFWRDLATQIAKVHKAEQEGFGFVEDNYIGDNVQYNRCSQAEISWADFFWKYRVSPQLKWAKEKRKLKLAPDVEALLKMTILNELSKTKEPPTLVHGDFWHGNFICNSEQKAYLIDPSTYYGHRETDIAMAELFGGFSPIFFDHYKQIAPLDDGFAVRRKIYNLYQLLNHFNIFGSHYQASVEKVLRKILKG